LKANAVWSFGAELGVCQPSFAEQLSDLDAVIDFIASAGEGSLRRVTSFLVEPDPVGLAGLEALLEIGKLQVHVDEVFGLEQAAEARRRAEDHHCGGKVVLRVLR